MSADVSRRKQRGGGIGVLKGFKVGGKGTAFGAHIDWQYLSLGDLEQNEISLKVDLDVLLCLNI